MRLLVLVCALSLLWGAGAAQAGEPDFAGAQEACGKLERKETCRLVVSTAAMHYGRDAHAFKLWRNKAAEYRGVWFHLWKFPPPNF